MSLAGISPAFKSNDRTPASQASAAKDVRVMVVDDSLTVRTVFQRVLENAGGFLLVASVPTAEEAIEQLRRVRVDVILLDLEMPGMGGLKALPEILRRSRGAQILVVSTLTSEGARPSIEAMSMGAADTMLKPKSGGFTPEYRASLIQKIRALGGTGKSEKTGEIPETALPRASLENIPRRTKALLIGASTGGIHALGQFLHALPSAVDQPIFITQHLPRNFMSVFARQMQATAGRPSVLAEPGTVVRAGHIYIASGEGHLVLRARGQEIVCEALDKAMPSGCVPSVDPMFSSAAVAYDGSVTGIVLSGMGRDGLDGAKAIVAAGGTIVAQDAHSCAVWGMPGAVVKAGLAQKIDTPAKLAANIAEALGAA